MYYVVEAGSHLEGRYVAGIAPCGRLLLSPEWHRRRLWATAIHAIRVACLARRQYPGADFTIFAED